MVQLAQKNDERGMFKYLIVEKIRRLNVAFDQRQSDDFLSLGGFMLTLLGSVSDFYTNYDETCGCLTRMGHQTEL